MKFLLFLLLFLGTYNTLLTQTYQFDHITLESGLHESGVFSLHQDQKGFLWIGTCNGLVRYDGINLKTFQKESTGKYDMGAACIYNIDEDEDGNFWLATYKGIFFFDVKKESIHYFQHQKELTGQQYQDMVTFVHKDQYNHLWFIDNAGKLYRVDLSTNHLISFDQNQAPASFFKDYEISVQRITLNFAPAFLEDSDGNIWIGSRANGLVKYLPKSDRFVHYLNEPSKPESISSNQIINLFEDNQKRIWIGTQNGLNYWNKQDSNFLRYQHQAESPESLMAAPAWVTLQDKEENLWVATQGGVDRLEPITGNITHYPSGNNQHYMVPIHEGKDGSFWTMDWNKTASTAVLNELIRPSRNFIPYPSQKDNPTSVFSGIGFTQTLADYAGVLWIGSFREGINKLDISGRKFLPYHPQGGKVMTFQPDASEIAAGNNANISIRIDDKGVMWLVEDNKLSWIRLHCTDHHGNIWISNNLRAFDTNGLGISRLNTSTLTYSRFFTKEDVQQTPCGSSANAMIVDREGRIWVGFWDYSTSAPGGLACYDPQTQKIKCYQPNPNTLNSLEHESIGDLWEDPNGNIWIGFQGSNLALQKLDPKKEQFSTYEEIRATTWAIEEDLEGKMWIGTILDGLVLFDPISGKIIKSYQNKDGLPNSSIQDIVVDEENNLWLRTEFGLSKFNQAESTFKNFTTADRLTTNRSNGNHLAFQGPTKALFIATPNQGAETELVYFNPSDIKDNPYPPKISLTEFKIFNKDVPIGPESPLKESISTTKKIHLAHDQNSFSFTFAALHFNRPKANEYAFKLEPFQKDWIYNGTQNNATYTNLNPGQYTFRVKAANFDGVWNEEGIELLIRIFPPWWKTWWAYTAYLLAAVGLFLGLRQYELRRMRAKAEAERLAELDQLKSRLYTNITHEFRTPLTVIQGMADQIEGQPEAKRLIQRNSKSLLHLVTQLLDMAKLESGKLNLQLIQADIIPFLRYLMEAFQSYAASQNIKLSFSSDVDELVMDYDPERLQHIIANLLSNAIKFIPESGNVDLTISYREKAQLLNIFIKDDGIGIQEQHLPHIFDRFFQVASDSSYSGEGTGIGLALVKELAEIMGGSVSVESQRGRGSTFMVSLPVKKDETLAGIGARIPVNRPIPSLPHPDLPDHSDSIPAAPPDKDLPILLIIEDNADVVTYIKTCLQDSFQLHLAYNGEDGIQKALDIIPDIIISDVMMPKKDGYEVTRVLKNEEKTSHIPIILLTAKADQASKIEGLSRGADAYLAKPFDKKELLIRLQKLVELREKMQNRYSSLGQLPPSSDPILQMEDAFLKKVRTQVEAHLDDSQFGVSLLCKTMNMSQSQLYRKIKALTNQSIASHIRIIRLQNGKRLLESTNLTVSEVAYKVGFTDPFYFSKTYSETFGHPPSEQRYSK